MTGGHVPTKGKGKRSGPPNEGSGGKRVDSPVSLSGWPQSCGTCRFFGDQVVTEISELGAKDFEMPVCRKNAPMIGFHSAQGVFPVMSKDQWCGDWDAPWPPVKRRSKADRFTKGYPDIRLRPACDHTSTYTDEDMDTICDDCKLIMTGLLKGHYLKAGHIIDDGEGPLKPVDCPKSPDGGHSYRDTSGKCALCGHSVDD